MSFDLELAKGDLRVAADKDLAKVRNGSKLAQDVLKVVFTPIGSDPFFPTKGNALTQENIGQIVNRQFMEDRATASLMTSLLSIQTLQTIQARTQNVTPEETLQEILEVTVVQDALEPRQYNISLTVLTGAFTVVELPNFSISTGID